MSWDQSSGTLSREKESAHTVIQVPIFPLIRADALKDAVL